MADEYSSAMRTLSRFLIFLSFCVLCSAGECGRAIYNLLLLTPGRRAVFPESRGARFLPLPIFWCATAGPSIVGLGMPCTKAAWLIGCDAVEK
jgi:hypothetical protein